MRKVLFAVLAFGMVLRAAPDSPGSDVVFRSDVSLVRVDVQVLDRNNHAISGLTQQDFELREEGRPQQIHNFAREEMPVDLLFLFDVSASMRPHVQRIASASHDALQVLARNDRVGIMVFDRNSRVRLPFKESRSEVERALDDMLQQESFRGGTDITRGLISAANYMELHGRPDARHAIVILTDDQTEFERDEESVSRELERADAVLSALIAPDAMAGIYSQRRGGGGSYPGAGGQWPGSGGPLGGIILGRRGGYGRRPTPPGAHTQSAGTSSIARRSGGDSLPVNEASALETTIERIRQRYALHFHMPPDAGPGQERHVDVQLVAAARQRYPDAELRFRRTYLTSRSAAEPSRGADSPTLITGAPAAPITPGTTASSQGNSPAPALKRRTAISEPDSAHGPLIVDGNSGSSRPSPAAVPASVQPSQPSATPTVTQQSPDSTPEQPHRGWRRVQPGDQQQ